MERSERIPLRDLPFEQRADLFVQELSQLADSLLADPADKRTTKGIAWEIIQSHDGSLSPAIREAARVSVKSARESIQEGQNPAVNRFVFESNWLELTYFGNEIRKPCHARPSLLVRLAQSHSPL